MTSDQERTPNERSATSAYIDEAPRMEIEGRGVSFGLINQAMGAKNLAVHINVLRPNTVGPYHYHADAEDVYIVLAGTGRILIEGEEHIVGPDQVMFIPPGLKHSVSNPGPGILKLIEIYSPPAHPHDFHLVG
jgi:mannose-6-phosphate isomerase-like protein (cupin superfamily)